MKEQSTKELLDLLLSRLNIDANNPMMALKRQWMEIIGSDIAIHCRLSDIKGKTAIIETDHSTYSSLILLRKQQIIRNMARLYPELKVTQLQIRIKPPVS